MRVTWLRASACLNLMLFVESGKLLVRVWDNKDDSSYEITLHPGDFYKLNRSLSSI